ncbi:MetQ/NlpA family ABC transporter substrate-binding protein [Mycoplasmatota bacterium]|nr:MetQ/NlpA family ABC transporter substrate-binding protein [Mycoplasmatota bacterium]
MRQMRKLFIVLVLTIGLFGCANSKSQTLKIAATSVPHAEILEVAKPILKSEYNIDLDIVVVQDYVTPNKFLASGDVDANFFQHIPYFESQISDFGYDFTNVGEIHIEPIGVYSKEYDNISDLPDGATIIFSSSVADHGRILSLLEVAGLIEIDPTVIKINAEVKDIVSNTKNFIFKSDIEASLLPTAFNNSEGDAVIINTNYALQAGLNPLQDAILIENEKSLYVNIIAVTTENKDDENILNLVKVLQSETIKDYIINNYEGAVVPVD